MESTDPQTPDVEELRAIMKKAGVQNVDQMSDEVVAAWARATTRALIEFGQTMSRLMGEVAESLTELFSRLGPVMEMIDEAQRKRP